MRIELQYHNNILTIWRGQEHLFTFELHPFELGDNDWIDLPSRIGEKLAEILKNGK